MLWQIALLPRLEEVPFLNPEWREGEEQLKEACARLRNGQLVQDEEEGSGVNDGESLPMLFPPVSDEICDSVDAMDR